MFNEAFAGTLPMQASTVAGSWDLLWNFLVYLSIFFFVVVVGGMIYLAIRYRNRPGSRPKYITGNHLVEAVWTLIPLILLMVIFGWGYHVYNQMTRAPHDAYEIRVIGKQWLWQFQYDDGRTTVNELYVPSNRPVKLVMTSEDVIHSFFVPTFRVKQDVVPGMYTSIWFEATAVGKHQIYCTEYCGTSHSGMIARIVVLNDSQWDQWRAGKKLQDVRDGSDGAGQPVAATEPASGVQGDSQSDKVRLVAAAPLSLAKQGEKLSQAKGCVACHSADGTAKIGPTFKGAYGHPVELADGRKVEFDDNYLRESIVDPQAKLVKGFNPVMPTFQGQLNASETNALIAYIKSLK